MHDNVEPGKANIMKLNEKMKHRHYSPHALAKIMGVPYTSLREKFNGIGHFTVPEMIWISMLLQLTPKDIFEIFILPYVRLYQVVIPQCMQEKEDAV